MDNVQKILQPLTKNPLQLTEKPTGPTNEQLQRDCGYHKAQELLHALREADLLSAQEFSEIAQLNRETFRPFLFEIMQNTTG